MNDIQVNALNVRVWAVEGGVHPARAPQFLSMGKFSDDPSKTIGEETKVGAPDPNNFNRDIEIGTVPGERERATFGIGNRYVDDRALLLAWANKQCRVDVFALVGKCGNPQDFTEGGEKFVYFPDGKISSHSFENFGAFDQSENNPTNEMVDMTSEDYWEFLYMRQETIGASVTTREVFTVDTYSGNDCEDCPDECKKIFMTMAGASATPGTQPTLLYSSDAGQNFGQNTISSLFANEDVKDAEVVGDYFVLLSKIGNSIHWTSATEVFDLNNTWNRVGNGFVVGKTPNAMTVNDVRHVWIVGDGGYVYFTSSFKIGVDVQDPGNATTQNLNAVNAHDTENVLAVGNSNSVIFTQNGGLSWEAVTGPSVGVNLGACWMWNENVWMVGEGAGGNGKLWLTVNRGVSWTQIGLPITLNRVDKILFVSEAEGYLIGRSGGSGYVLRTITGGYEWTTVPQGKKGSPVLNSRLNDIGVCSKYQNTAFAVGLASNGTAGIALRMNG